MHLHYPHLGEKRGTKERAEKEQKAKVMCGKTKSVRKACKINLPLHRVLVRAAALKGKNPNDIVAELEKIDDMEFNVLMPPPLNGKVRE